MDPAVRIVRSANRWCGSGDERRMEDGDGVTECDFLFIDASADVLPMTTESGIETPLRNCWTTKTFGAKSTAL